MTVRRFRLIFLILLISTLGWLAPVSKGQQPGGTTQVIGVVKDPLGNLYTNSQVSFIFYDPGTSGKLPLLNGSTFQQTFTGYATDSFGNIPSGIYLPDNGVIASSSGATGTQWIIKVCFSDRVTCFTTTQTINCSSNIPVTCTLGVMDLTSLLQSVAATLPQVPGVPGGTTGSVQCNNANHFIACPDATDSGGNFAISGNLPVTGNFTATTGQNKLSAYNINNIVAVDGSKYTTATAALADPACSQASNAGCTIDMRGNSSPTALNLGTFDPGSSAPAVQLLLGPFVYHATQIKLRNGLQVIGVNSGGGVGASPSTPSPPPTEIISNDTTTPLIVLGGSAAVLGVGISHLRLYCGAGNTSQIGIDIVAQHSFPASSGLWYSTFNDLFIGGDGVHECLGNPMLIDGNDAGSGNVNGAAINQFLSFRDVRFFRGNNGGPVLITGLNGQFTFDGAIEFDGPTPRDNNTVNLIINDGTETFRAPYTFLFTNMTVQLAWGNTGRCVQINGVKGLVITGGHFENCNGGIQLAVGHLFGNKGVSIIGSTFDTNTAIDGGHGYILSMDVNSQVNFIGNTMDGTPDTAFVGDLTYLYHDVTMNAGNGLPYAVPSELSRFRFPLGFFGDSGGFKSAATSFTGVAAGAYQEVDVTWITPFPDGTYIPICSVYDFTTGATSAGLRFERLLGAGSLDPTKIKGIVFNSSAGPLNGTLFCAAFHN